MPADHIHRLQSILDHDGARPRRALEAGCGSLQRALDLGDDAHIVGIEISGEQLRRNDAVDQRVLGDLQTHEFAPGEFDLSLGRARARSRSGHSRPSVTPRPTAVSSS